MAWAAVSALVVGLVVVSPAIAGRPYKGFERGEALIAPQELKRLMDAEDSKLVLVGVVRAGLTGSFTRGHLPEAYSVWRPDYTTSAGEPYPYEGMVMNAEDFQEFARSLGIDDDSKVVLYDEECDATRLWWTFFLYGKTDVRILDGGYEGWKEAGYDTEMGGGGDKGSKTGNFVARPRRAAMVASMDDVRRARTDSTLQLWDTREPEEWSGDKLERGAYRKGRIPWAKFLSWRDFRVEVNGAPTEFRSAAEIEQVIEKNEIDRDKGQIFYCQSGVRTTTHIFALYLMGWDIERLLNYDGSWVEWSYHESNPVEKGL